MDNGLCFKAADADNRFYFYYEYGFFFWEVRLEQYTKESL